MKTSGVLHKAKEILKRDGWQRHYFNDDNNEPHCLLGAIYKASGLDDAPLDANLGKLIVWNDTVCKNDDEACAMLDKMITLAEARGL